MLRPRIIPCLLMRDKGLVKTVKFKEGKYIGDPINAVRIFNEKEADELIVLDIDATTHGTEPDFHRISYLASECQMPLCYGGGVHTVDQAKKIIALGVEKVAISSAAVENPEIISKISAEIGRQSVVVVLDIKKKRLIKAFDVWSHNATKNSKRDVLSVIEQVQKLGAGEVVLNFIDRDGTMKGYDIDFINKVKSVCRVPLTVLGGAGSLSDMGDVVARCGLVGLAAGSLLVFKGKYRAVLINYPSDEVKNNNIYNRLKHD
ncbi:MAG: AglZ/HisF2 family acetamidino modification protein [Pseudomonadota bacterium]